MTAPETAGDAAARPMAGLVPGGRGTYPNPYAPCQRPAEHPGPRFPGAEAFCLVPGHHVPSGYAPLHAGPESVSRDAELADAQSLVNRAGAAMDKARADLRDAAELATVTQNDYTRAMAILTEVESVQAGVTGPDPWDYSTLPKPGPSMADVRKHVTEQRDHWGGFQFTMQSAQGRDLATTVVAVLTDVLSYMDGEL